MATRRTWLACSVHHLLPRQLLACRSFGPLFDTIGRNRVDFEDFRPSGLLLPACDSAAMRAGLPLHRGPHRVYNALVCERIGQIEADWSALRAKTPEFALDHALMRISLLQRALRRRLLAERRRLRVNRHDPLGSGVDFSQLDAMANALWASTPDQVREGGLAEPLLIETPPLASTVPDCDRHRRLALARTARDAVPPAGARLRRYQRLIEPSIRASSRLSYSHMFLSFEVAADYCTVASWSRSGSKSPLFCSRSSGVHFAFRRNALFGPKNRLPLQTYS